MKDSNGIQYEIEKRLLIIYLDVKNSMRRGKKNCRDEIFLPGNENSMYCHVNRSNQIRPAHRMPFSYIYDREKKTEEAPLYKVVLVLH